MTPSISPAQPSHQAVSPTQGVPAPDGGPSPFEAYLGTLRKSLTLSAFALSPPAPAAPPQPAPEAKKPVTPAESQPEHDPCAHEPDAKPADHAENAHPETEPAPEDAPRRKDRADAQDPAPAQPPADPVCAPALHTDAGNAQEPTP